MRKTLPLSMQLCTRCTDIALCPLRIHFGTCIMPLRVVFDPCGVVSCCLSSLGQGSITLGISVGIWFAYRNRIIVAVCWKLRGRYEARRSNGYPWHKTTWVSYHTWKSQVHRRFALYLCEKNIVCFIATMYEMHRDSFLSPPYPL